MSIPKLSVEDTMTTITAKQSLIAGDTITAKVVFEPPNPSFFDPANFDNENPEFDDFNYISFEEFFIAKGRDIAFDLLEFIYRTSFWYEHCKNDKSISEYLRKSCEDFEIWIESNTPYAIFFKFPNIPKEIKSGVAYVTNVPFDIRNYNSYKEYHKNFNSFFHFSLLRHYFEVGLNWIDYYPGQNQFKVKNRYIEMHIDSIIF